ncbi:hypothetical protein [Staphylococcus xylosus]|uniref:hypothetical protein n=1 Tax=Staphylococcus xylosus TaxID=1288 RepID=UPI000D1F0DA2|nr:hypothetical protein [Staphylococcus xylosus]PTI25062.1 hypothetical protein BU115_07020 [Staphylococcus xylosus]
MKIKTKKQLNLPQLIEWAWENDIRDSEFQTVKNERGVFYEVYFSEEGNFCSNDELDSKDLFTIEVEEEITEDTVLPKLVTKNINGGYNGWTDRSIDSFIIGYMEAIYIPNDDLTMTLIWRDGKLVE